MIRLSIPLPNACSQCYYGAKNMCGIKNGISNKILSQNPEAFFAHCFRHAHCAEDIVKNVRFLKDSMDTTCKISNNINKSLKRNAMQQKIQKDPSLEYQGFRIPSPTRWTVRPASIKVILDDWVALQQVWDESLDGNLEPEIKGRTIDVKKPDEYF